MSYDVIVYSFFALIIALLLFLLREILRLKGEIAQNSENMSLIKKNCVIFNISKYMKKK
jgi:hypothetical protein